MCRAVYPYELDDPDFSWLISKFREENPSFTIVEVANLPLTLISLVDTEADIVEESVIVPTGKERTEAPLKR